MKLITKDDDLLDELCHNVDTPIVYSVEAVFEANPGLAAYGPVLCQHHHLSAAGDPKTVACPVVGLTPIFSVTVGGNDVTARIAQCLTRLTITDEVGVKSDTLRR